MQAPDTFLSDQFYTKKVRDLHFRHLRMARHSDPVYECAALMKKEKVSCLFIGNSPQEISGYITDITLRDNLLAMRRSPELPVSQIMEFDMVSIHPDTSLIEALILMFQTKNPLAWEGSQLRRAYQGPKPTQPRPTLPKRSA